MTVSRKSKGGTEPTENVRERILATARELIYREGARAVGVDRIVAESGVAKMSLYRWFPSKDDLIVEVLRESERRVWEVWDENVRRFPGEPSAQLRAQFESLAASIERPTYRGCAFLNAAMAFADETHPSRAVVKSFKEELIRRVEGLAGEMGVRQPRVFAEQLSLLVDGAHSSGQAVGKQGPCRQLLAMFDTLMNAHVPQQH